MVGATFKVMCRETEAAHRRWTAVFAEHRPEMADLLWEHHRRYLAKNEQLEGLFLLLGTNPALPVDTLYREYSKALDAGEPDTDLTHDGEGLGPRQRSARTRKYRTREQLLKAATDLVVAGDISDDFLERAARNANVGVATAYTHFNKSELIAAVCKRLLEPVLGEEGAP